MDDFVARNRKVYSEKKIVGFANRMSVHPGIVLGQLHFRKELEFSVLRKLLVKVRGELIQSALSDGWGMCPSLSIES